MTVVYPRVYHREHPVKFNMESTSFCFDVNHIDNAAFSFSNSSLSRSLHSIITEFFELNHLKPSGTSHSTGLFLKMMDRRCVVDPVSVEPFYEPPGLPIRFHCPNMVEFTVTTGEPKLNLPVSCPSFRQGMPSFKFLTSPNISISCVADIIRTPLGPDTILDNNLFPISHYVLVHERDGFWLAPVYVDFGIVEMRVRSRYRDDSYHLPSWFSRAYLSRTQSLWYHRTAWISFSPAGIAELILILSGDVELNPGPPESYETADILRDRGGGQPKGGYRIINKPLNRQKKKMAAIGASLVRTQQEQQGTEDARNRFAREVLIPPKRSRDSSMPPLERGPNDPPNPGSSAKPVVLDVGGNNDVFQVGQTFVGEVEFEKTKDGWVMRPSQDESKWPVVTILDVDPSGDIEVECSGFPVKRFPRVLITRREMLASQKAKIWVSPDTNLVNLCFALNRVPDRSASPEHNYLVAMILCVMSSPHSGYVYFPDSTVTIHLYSVPLQLDADGNPIGRKELEEEGYRFDDNYDLNAHKQNQRIHTGCCGFNCPVFVPSWSVPNNIYAMIGKRFSPRTMNPVSDAFLDMLERAAHELVDFVSHRLPDHNTRKMCFEKFVAGRSASEKNQAWLFYGEFEEHFEDCLREYQSSSVDFFPKCEVYSSEKPPRGIACRSFKWRCFQAYCMGPVLYAIEKALEDSNVKGLTSHEIRAKLSEKFETTVSAFETDFSSFEANLRPNVRRRSENVVFSGVSALLGDTDLTEGVIRDNGKDFCRVTCSALGWHNNRFPTIRFSGDYWTSIGNQVCNLLITYVLMKNLLLGEGQELSLADYLDKSLFEGDDGIMERHGVTKEEFDRAAGEAGFRLKVEEGDWTELSFCGNRMMELPDGTLVRSREQAMIAAQLSVIFTALPRNAASYGAYTSLQRSKAISFLDSQEGWVADTTILGWLIEGRTRSAFGDEKRRRVFMSAYGRISEYMPFSLESCLTKHPIDSFRRLTSLIPGSDAWVDELFICNTEAGGTFTRSDIRRMWLQLNDPERGCFADVPGLSNDSTIEIVANRKYEIETKKKIDREYADKLEAVARERQRYLAKEAYACSENISRSLKTAKRMQNIVEWRYKWLQEWVLNLSLVLLAVAWGVFVFRLSAPPGIPPIDYSQMSPADYKTYWDMGQSPAELMCPNVGTSPWYGYCVEGNESYSPIIPYEGPPPSYDWSSFAEDDIPSYYGVNQDALPVEPDRIWRNRHVGIDYVLDVFVMLIPGALMVLAILELIGCCCSDLSSRGLNPPDPDDEE